MKLSRRSIAVLIPLLGLAMSFSALFTGCSDSQCSAGTVRMNIAVPNAVGAVDITFEMDQQVVHRERLPVAAGASTVSADIVLPNGYPANKKVVVTAMGKRVDAGVEVTV